MKTCNHFKDVPDGDHYVILEFDSIYVHGDQRSIDYPGHGYPASTENFSRYISFTNKDEWETEITKRMNSQYSRKEFVALKVSRAVIETSHKVKIS